MENELQARNGKLNDFSKFYQDELILFIKNWRQDDILLSRIGDELMKTMFE